MAEWDPDGTLTADDWNFFRDSKRRVNDTYGMGLAQNQFSREQAASQYGRQRNDLITQWDRVRQGFSRPYQRRGLMNSGIYQQGLVQYAQDKNRAFGNLEANYQGQTGALSLGDQQLEGVRAGALEDLANQEAARRATIAAQLRKYGLGG